MFLKYGCKMNIDFFECLKLSLKLIVITIVIPPIFFFTVIFILRITEDISFFKKRVYSKQCNSKKCNSKQGNSKSKNDFVKNKPEFQIKETELILSKQTSD